MRMKHPKLTWKWRSAIEWQLHSKWMCEECYYKVEIIIKTGVLWEIYLSPYHRVRSLFKKEFNLMNYRRNWNEIFSTEFQHIPWTWAIHECHYPFLMNDTSTCEKVPQLKAQCYSRYRLIVASISYSCDKLLIHRIFVTGTLRNKIPICILWMEMLLYDFTIKWFPRVCVFVLQFLRSSINWKWQRNAASKIMNANEWVGVFRTCQILTKIPTRICRNRWG